MSIFGFYLVQSDKTNGSLLCSDDSSEQVVFFFYFCTLWTLFTVNSLSPSVITTESHGTPWYCLSKASLQTDDRSKPGQIRSLLCSGCIVWECGVFVTSNPFQTYVKDPQKQASGGDCCLHARLQQPNTLLSSYRAVWPADFSKTLCTAVTRYLSIPSLVGLHNGTTNSCCVPLMHSLCNLVVYTGQTFEWVRCGSVRGHYRNESRCMMSVRCQSVYTFMVSQQHWWSDLLLAAVILRGTDVQTVSVAVPAGFKHTIPPYSLEQSCGQSFY